MLLVSSSKRLESEACVMEVQGPKVVRKKLASYKGSIQEAERRTEKAKQSLQLVEKRFIRAICKKSKMEDLIRKRQMQLERAEARITSIQLKWDALVRFYEEMNVLVPGYHQSGLEDQEFDTEIAKFTEKTEKAKKKYNAGVDRERVLRDKTERARGRQIRAESALRELQEQLTSIKKRVQDLDERKLQRDARWHQMETLEAKVKRALAKAQERENTEVELEEKIIELEDQIEMYVQRKKRAISFLADRENNNPVQSWTISFWVQKSPQTTYRSSISITVGGANDT